MDKHKDERHAIRSNTEYHEKELRDRVINYYHLGLTIDAIAEREAMSYYKVKDIIVNHVLI